jgi:hypothetical protein
VTPATAASRNVDEIIVKGSYGPRWPTIPGFSAGRGESRIAAGRDIDGTMSLITDGQLDYMLRLAATSDHDLLVRVPDYHDSFTKNIWRNWSGKRIGARLAISPRYWGLRRQYIDRLSRDILPIPAASGRAFCSLSGVTGMSRSLVVLFGSAW